MRDPRQVRVLIGLVAEHDAPDGELVLRVDGAVVATRAIAAPEGAGDEAFTRLDLVLGPFTFDAGASVEVELLVSDANPADNVVWLELPPPNPLRVQAIAPVPDLIRFGLESLDPASFDVVDSPEAFQPGYDFTVWPAESFGDTVLPEGRHLVLGGVPNGLGVTQDNDQTTPAVVMATEALHPVMRGVGVGRLEILKPSVERFWRGNRAMSGPSGDRCLPPNRGADGVVAVGFDPMESTGPHSLDLWPSWPTPRPGSQKFQRPMRMSRVMCFDCKEFLVRTQCCQGPA